MRRDSHLIPFGNLLSVPVHYKRNQAQIVYSVSSSVLMFTVHSLECCVHKHCCCLALPTQPSHIFSYERFVALTLKERRLFVSLPSVLTDCLKWKNITEITRNPAKCLAKSLILLPSCLHARVSSHGDPVLEDTNHRINKPWFPEHP